MADAKEKNRQLEAEREKDAKERKDLENDIAHRKTYMWCLVNRKGSLFFGSVQGALRSAMYNTFIQTCKQVGVSFRQYFKALLKAVKSGRTDYELPQHAA